MPKPKPLKTGPRSIFFVSRRRNEIIALVRQGLRMNIVARRMNCSMNVIHCALEARGYASMYVHESERAQLLAQRRKQDAIPFDLPKPTALHPHQAVKIAHA